MQPLLYHLYSGQMFFSAALVLALSATAALLGALDRSAVLRSAASVLSLASIFVAALSGTPMHLAQAVVAATCAAAFALFGIVAPPARRRALATAAIVAALACAVSEARWHVRAPRLPVPTRLIVIGDSLSSGGFGESATWPMLLGRAVGAETRNLALPGETASSAREFQLPELPPPLEGDCVVVAIGGNDMLEGLAADAFESALDAILEAAVAGGARRVAMLELPIVPGEWRFGAIQRRLALKHGVPLLPKRIIARVLLTPGCTYDGLHPTQRGHENLARELRRYFGW